MKTCIAVLILMFTINNDALSQFELSTGYAVNKNLLDGMPIHAAYEFNLGKSIFTKSQIGYKRLKHYNDFVGANLKVQIVELHQTFSYQIVKRKKYILQPNIGVNYRFYNWEGKMVPPYDVLPRRGYRIEFRDNWLRLSSYNSTDPLEGSISDEYQTNNFGFSIQLQNQFKLKEKIWLHITPFVEPDYDRSENTGGCYVGVIFK